MSHLALMMQKYLLYHQGDLVLGLSYKESIFCAIINKIKINFLTPNSPTICVNFDQKR